MRRFDLVDSKSDKRLQVADVPAGAAYYWAIGLAEKRVDRVHERDLRSLLATPFWPSMEVSPAEIGTIDDGDGTN